MGFDTLLFERREHVVHVTLNRGDKLNALNLHLIEDLRAAAAAIAADPEISSRAAHRCGTRFLRRRRYRGK